MKTHARLLVISLCITQLLSAQENAKNFASYFKPEKKYLVLPVKNDAPKKNIEIWVDGVMERYFDIELADGPGDWNAYLQIDQWKGKKVELRVDQLSDQSKTFRPFLQSDNNDNNNAYAESLRPQFHFSPKLGWTNDPNGMVFFNGEYHLFYQHNPYGKKWGNMTWGHAVSKDLIHWTHLDDAIHPDQGGPVFSGGAVVDSFNTSGLGKPGKPALVAFHTGAKGWAQYMSWSTDGINFQTLDRAAVPRINADNRDPKVIWFEPTKKWVMVIWVERPDNGKHSMQFLTSPDLINWTEASFVTGGYKAEDRYLFECPEFYELPVQGMPGVKKWVLTGANTQYAIGEFDGTTFKPEEERLQNQHGRSFYAPQTFSNEPTGRRIELGWWLTQTGMGTSSFEHSMSLPLEHKLVKTAEGIRLTRTPVKEVEALRGQVHSFKSLSLKENGANPLKELSLELAEMKFELVPGKAKEVILNIRGLDLIYNVTAQQLTVDGVKAPATLINGKLKLQIFADRTGVEVFVNDGIVYMPVNYNLTAENKSFALSVKGGSAKVNNLEVYELKSIYSGQ
ncbi:MAG: glycosyl hydrolase family 32 [Citrobacter freundii]|nr:MAG: glycosyl hydrolase family 32 [Citrobacter freundii]